MFRTILVKFIFPVTNFIQSVNRIVFKYFVAPLIYSILFSIAALLLLRIYWQRKLLASLEESAVVKSPWKEPIHDTSAIARRILSIKNEEIFPKEMGFRQRALLQYSKHSLPQTKNLVFVLHENNVPYHGAYIFNEPRYRDVILNGSAAFVHWDQTGMGMNFGVRRQTLDEMVEDFRVVLEGAVRQVNYFIALELDEEETLDDSQNPHNLRVFVMGVGSGNLLGVRFIQKYPQLVNKYFSVSGLIGNWDEVDYAVWTHHHETGTDDQLVLNPLERMGPPPYMGDVQQQFADHMNLRMIALRNGGMVVAKKGESALSNFVKHTFLEMARSPDYSLVELWFMAWMKRGQAWLWGDLRNVNLEAEVQRVECPVVFLHGAADWFGAPVEFVRRWHDKLDAPYKNLHVIENAGYLLFIEKKHEMERILLQEIRTETRN